MATRQKGNARPLDPHHCRCFSVPKSHFRYLEAKLLSLNFVEPILEEDHGQILGLTKRLSEYYQIHVKLMRTGRLEAEIEYPHDYPFAHLNPTHSYSAHAELLQLLSYIQIPFKSRRIPPITCLKRQIIAAQQPTHMGTVLGVGAIGALLDLAFNDGKITAKVLEVASDEIRKHQTKKTKRRKYLG